MKCEWCGLVPQDGTTVFRVNEKGVPGIWRCEKDLDRKPPDDVAEIVAILESNNAPTH